MHLIQGMMGANGTKGNTGLPGARGLPGIKVFIFMYAVSLIFLGIERKQRYKR